MTERRFDPESGIIYVTADSALLSSADVDAHYEALRALIAEVRAAGHPVRILSNVTAAPRQPPEIEQCILDQIARTYRAGDRIAIVAANTADKDYLRSRSPSAAITAFASVMAGEMWLFLDEVR